MRMIAILIGAVLLLLNLGTATLADVNEPMLTVTLGDVTHRFTASTLLARPDAAEVTVPNDPSYQRSMVYRAVPLLPLLTGLASNRFDALEVRATDGFVAQLPLPLVYGGAADGAVAWIAIEPPATPDPPCPARTQAQDHFT